MCLQCKSGLIRHVPYFIKSVLPLTDTQGYVHDTLDLGGRRVESFTKRQNLHVVSGNTEWCECQGLRFVITQGE